MNHIENKTFDEIKVGDTVTLQHTLLKKDIELFSIMSGDVNPAHVDPQFAKDDMFHKITLDATALCKMAERGQITGGILDGPLALDNAISVYYRESRSFTL